MHVQSCCFAYKPIGFFLTFSLPSASLDLTVPINTTHRPLHTMAPLLAARILVMRLLYIDDLMGVALGTENCALEGYCLVITQANQCGEFRMPKWPISS